MDELLEMLALQSCKDVYIGDSLSRGISGGQVGCQTLLWGPCVWSRIEVWGRGLEHLREADGCQSLCGSELRIWSSWARLGAAARVAGRDCSQASGTRIKA